MKRGKKLIVMLLALVLLSGAAVLATRLNPEDQTPEEENSTLTVYSTNTDSIKKITWARGEESFELANSNGEWSYAEDAALPLDAAVVETILDALDEIVATKTIETPEDLAQYGLEEPELTIDITADAQTQLLVGNENSMDGQRYLSLSGDENVYLVHPAIFYAFDLELYDLVQEESIPDMTGVEALHLKAETQSYNIVRREQSGRTYSDSYIWFMESADGYRTLDTELTQALLSSVTGITWSECVDYSAERDELAKYGLDNPSVTVTVDYVQTAEDKEIRDSFTLELGGYSDSRCYARIAGSDMVYLVDGAISDKLLYTTAEDLKPDEVLLMDWDTVTAVDFTVDGQTHRAERVTTSETDADGKTTQKTVWQIKGKEVAMSVVLPELNALASAGYADGITPERSLRVGFVFHRSTETFTQVELNFYQYDSTNCLATLDGESRVFVANGDVDGIVMLAQALVTASQREE